MKAEIQKDRFVHIIPETMAECLALELLFPASGDTKDWSQNIVIHGEYHIKEPEPAK
jgi:hypothetical protein